MRRYYIGIFLLVVLSVVSLGSHYAITNKGVSDRQTLDDISILDQKIDDYANKNKKLPEQLKEIDFDKQKVAKRLDSYTYKDLGRTKDGHDFLYQLCATFKTSKSDRDYNYDDETDYVSTSSGHAKGHQCFKQKIYASFDAYDDQVLSDSTNPLLGAQCGPLPKTLFEKRSIIITSIFPDISQFYTKVGAQVTAYQWCFPLTVVDKNGIGLTINDLKVGDTVTISGANTSHIQSIKLENR